MHAGTWQGERTLLGRDLEDRADRDAGEDRHRVRRIDDLRLVDPRRRRVVHVGRRIGPEREHRPDRRCHDRTRRDDELHGERHARLRQPEHAVRIEGRGLAGAVREVDEGGAERDPGEVVVDVDGSGSHAIAAEMISVDG